MAGVRFEQREPGRDAAIRRVTYELMIRYWPTPMAKQQNPAVADGMNSAPKIVVSRTLKEATWQNTKLLKDDLPGEMHKLKQQSGKGICILGSGTIVTQLAEARLIDELQIVVSPITLGKGKTPFETLKQRLPLKLLKTVRSPTATSFTITAGGINFDGKNKQGTNHGPQSRYARNHHS